MADYDKVSAALKSGADPQMLCATCPWDRFCINPPSMTEQEITDKIDEATKRDKQSAAEAPDGESKMPVNTLMTAMVYAGKASSATICPVLALQLRTPGGKHIVDVLKIAMQAPVLAADPR